MKNIVPSVLVAGLILTGCMTPKENGDRIIANQSTPEPALKQAIARTLLAKRPELAGNGAEVSNILPLGTNHAVVCVKSPKTPGAFPIVYVDENGPTIVSQGTSACGSERIRWNAFPELSR